MREFTGVHVLDLGHSSNDLCKFVSTEFVLIVDLQASLFVVDSDEDSVDGRKRQLLINDFPFLAEVHEVEPVDVGVTLLSGYLVDKGYLDGVIMLLQHLHCLFPVILIVYKLVQLIILFI